MALVALPLALVLAACGESQADGPPEIVEGRSECDECHMIIDDKRFAAAYRQPDGTERRFDDIGDLLAHSSAGGELADADVWVFDYYTKDAMLVGEAAFVVTDGDLATPMGWGVAAFAEPSEAETIVDDLGGQVVDWVELQALFVTGAVGAHLDGDESGPAGPGDGGPGDEQSESGSYGPGSGTEEEES